MTDTVPQQVRRAFADHDAFAEREESDEPGERGEHTGEQGDFLVGTTNFDASVLAEGSGGGENGSDGEENMETADASEAALRYRVLCRVPTLSAAVDGPVEGVVEEGWFETFSLRLEDAAMAVPGAIDVEGPEASMRGENVRVEATFETKSPNRAPQVAKALVDYVEGTYVEGVIPGYEYRPPVSNLLASARQGGGGTNGGSDNDGREGRSGPNAGGPTPM